MLGFIAQAFLKEGEFLWKLRLFPEDLEAFLFSKPSLSEHTLCTNVPFGEQLYPLHLFSLSLDGYVIA